MRDTEAAWLAGIIDGEGCIQINEHKAKPKAGGVNPSFEIQIAVVNTDKRIVDRCEEIAGGYVIGPVGRGLPGKWKPAYRWAAKRQKAALILRAVLPHLVSKREQAEVAMRLAELIQLGASKGSFGVIKLTADQLFERSVLKLAMQALNHRGGTPIPSDRTDALEKIRHQLNIPNVSLSRRVAIST